MAIFAFFRVYQTLQQTTLIVSLVPSIRCGQKESWAYQFQIFLGKVQQYYR